MQRLSWFKQNLRIYQWLAVFKCKTPCRIFINVYFLEWGFCQQTCRFFASVMSIFASVMSIKAYNRADVFYSHKEIEFKLTMAMSLYQSETIGAQPFICNVINFICMWKKTHFHIKGKYRPVLAYVKRVKAIWKGPIIVPTDEKWMNLLTD